MRRFSTILISLTLMTFLFASPALCLWGSDTLVTIDGATNTTEDFRTWWKFWNDADQPLPETPEFYIDWLLLAREGEIMGLAEDPAFQHRTEVFLKVRSLLMLQKEEIFDKINISDDELRETYEKLYTPIWLLERFQFGDEQKAQAAWQQLHDGTLTVEELETRFRAQGGHMALREDWRRPIGIDPFWTEIFKKLEVGEATEPIKDLDFYVFYILKKKEDGDAADFDKVKKPITDRIFDERRKELNAELMKRLITKYDVKVDNELIASLDINAPDDTFGDTPVITTNRKNFTEKEFMLLLHKDQSYRQSAIHTTEDADVIKNRVVNGIINQNLTDWEALDRHYEEREPLKDEYQFNIKHRLTLAVQGRLFASSATASEEEIKNYYTEHISRYTQPEIVNLVIIEDNDGAVDRVWGEVAAGKNFFTAVRENTEQSTASQPFPLQHLEPSVQKVVAVLAKGETSQPINSDGHRFLVHLTDRTPAKPLPLEQVAESIRTNIIQEKIAKERKEYLDLLKSRSVIKINESNWKSLQKELGGNK